jgi:uncharacterized protein (DUF58 family)
MVSEERPAAARSTQATFEGRLLLTGSSLLAVAALSLGENLVFWLACLSFSAALSTRWAVRRNLAAVRAAREAPARAEAGRPARIAYRVGAPDRATEGVLLDAPLPGGASPRRHRLEAQSLARGGDATRSLDVVFARRGLVTLPPIELRTRFPFGLFEASRRSGGGEAVLVWPRAGRPTALLQRRLRGVAAGEARAEARRPGEELLHGVREHRDGDDPRRIHWRSTARRGALVVAEWRQARSRALTIVLGRARGPGPEARRAFERAVAFAATAWRLAHALGLPARLVLGEGRGPIRRPGPGLDALATVRALGGRRPRAALRALPRLAEGECVLFVAAGPERDLLGHLPEGRSREAWCVRADLPEADALVRGLP